MILCVDVNVHNLNELLHEKRDPAYVGDYQTYDVPDPETVKEKIVEKVKEVKEKNPVVK